MREHGAQRKTRFGSVAFVGHVQVGEDRKLFASSHVGEQTAPTKVRTPPKLRADVTVRSTLWLVLFLQWYVEVFRCSGELSCV